MAPSSLNGEGERTNFVTFGRRSIHRLALPDREVESYLRVTAEHPRSHKNLLYVSSSSRISYHVKTIMMIHPHGGHPQLQEPLFHLSVMQGFHRYTTHQLRAGVRLARQISTAGIAHMSMVSNRCVSHQVPGVIVPIRVSRDRQQRCDGMHHLARMRPNSFSLPPAWHVSTWTIP